MNIRKQTFGVLSSGKKVRLYTLKAGGLSLSISTLGATWTSLRVPSRRTGTQDVLLGYSTLAPYASPKNYLGVTIGRFGNRIGGAQFTLNGKTYHLYKNDGDNSLHGGRRGFDKLLWKAEPYEEKDGVFVRFELDSPDGDEGYPGNLKAVVCYGLTKSRELIADYQARVDAESPVNLTNHAYFNLAGEGRGDILDHEVQIHGSSYVEVDAGLIPTGKLIPVAGGPFDFTAPKPIGRDFAGYDHCFVLDGGPTGPHEPGKLRPCAGVFEPKSGRTMRVLTTQPGVQFYTGNFLDALVGKEGSLYNRHDGFCLETQHLPDSPNRPEFPSCIFGPGRDYHERAIFSFDW
ncbi:aldose 1-epimerase [Spirochaetia bacterium]|nr:aldose 1-epimerase [Spirochaetia bacterium]